MRRSSVLTILCLIPWLFTACLSEDGYEKAVQVYEEGRVSEKLEAFQGYNIHRRGKGYHVFMPPQGARFVYTNGSGDSSSMRLVNESALRDNFADSYEWDDPTFLARMSEQARSLINAFEELGVVKINGRYRAGKYIKVYVTPVDVLIYAPGREELNPEEFDSLAEKVVKLDTQWLYLKQRQPLDISG